MALVVSAHNRCGVRCVRVALARAIGVALAIVFVSGAEAAEIRAVRGQVLVNEGTGYRAVEGPVRLKVGDAVIAAPRGLGSLSYDDGCTIEVAPGAIAWIRPRSPCAAVDGFDPSQDPAPVLQPRVRFDPGWLRDGAVLIDSRKPPAGP